MHADHPRACGANFRPVSRGCSRFGSSPRVRGKRMNERKCKSALRIIPARAGQTVALLSAANAPPDHPRACGANGSLYDTVKRMAGSSPRVRGKRRFCTSMSAPNRIIPARAGQTPWSCPGRTGWSDHPRACGANGWLPVEDRHNAGSSPRVRGKLRPLPRVRGGVRIIPARAGQTARCCWITTCSPDHPRACGANMDLTIANAYRPGSSPRVRGKRETGREKTRRNRIIPARAGQTRWCPPWRSLYPDHPRACGANGWLPIEDRYNTGSSPRVRGKREALHEHPARFRIIPARAGHTGLVSSSSVWRTDHPRACGANSGVFTLSANISGSSPRVRGKRVELWLFRIHRRIIPARAGQTRP